jgi:integrase
MSELENVKVFVIDYGRTYLYMRYVDPNSGEQIAKSSGMKTKKEANREAAKWEAELREGRYKSAGKVTWKEFRERYEGEVLNSLAAKTADKVATVFDAVEELTPVDRLAKLNSALLSKFQKKLRDDRKLAEATIKVYLAHLHAALNWANRVARILSDVPTIDMPKRAKGAKLMKGRAITLEEFERILAKVPDVAKDPKKVEVEKLTAVYRYQWFLRGLWFSGLRLGEALDFSWDEPGHITVDLSCKRPMFVIPGDRQKSGDDQLLPIAPEFAEMLLMVPVEERTGRVFKLGRRNIKNTPGLLALSHLVSKLGKLANVIVNRKPEKFASAHDFRRAFGERWSVRVMPATLQQMMRHQDIGTTMKYYVGQNSQKAAEEIYAAFAEKTAGHEKGNTLGNTPSNQAFLDSADSEVSSDEIKG